MNENVMDRYFWKTGERWSSDNRPVDHIRNPLRYGPFRKLRWRSVFWLMVAYLISMALLALSRLY